MQRSGHVIRIGPVHVEEFERVHVAVWQRASEAQSSPTRTGWAPIRRLNCGGLPVDAATRTRPPHGLKGRPGGAQAPAECPLVPAVNVV